MVEQGLESFCKKRVVLLQGPVGPFFKNLSMDLQNVGATVFKINFNGGDRFFSLPGSIDYTRGLNEWSGYFTEFVEKNRIDAVILFGDCRDYHRIAHSIADRKGIDIGVFEEGYIRPDYITFEKYGVNGHSLIPRNPDFYRSLESSEYVIGESISVGYTFWYTAWWAYLYYLFSALYYPRFRRYRHHRPLNPFELFYWIRSLWRKKWYKIKEKRFLECIVNELSKSYFLVPLQISTDSQVQKHSDFNSIEHFIDMVIKSFATHASGKTRLLIKHHPLDRGYNNYRPYIRKLAQKYGVSSRVDYIHDQFLPTLLEHTKGVVLINSTVGLTAVGHNTPVKVCGMAIYDFKGLTYQGELNQFWKDAENFTIDHDLYERFRGYVIRNKLINGSFYRKLDQSPLKSGILWNNG